MGQVMLTHEQDGNLETLFSCRLYKSETVFEGDVVEEGSLNVCRGARDMRIDRTKTSRDERHSRYWHPE